MNDPVTIFRAKVKFHIYIFKPDAVFAVSCLEFQSGVTPVAQRMLDISRSRVFPFFPVITQRIFDCAVRDRETSSGIAMPSTTCENTRRENCSVCFFACLFCAIA